MRFVFEYVGTKLLDKSESARLRRMMMCFEGMVNTVLPEVRVHLSEEHTKTPTKKQ